MPLYEYKCQEGTTGCPHCQRGFERIHAMSEKGPARCPKCGTPVERQISPPNAGASESSFDDRAKEAGFSKLKKLNWGEYEKEY